MKRFYALFIACMAIAATSCNHGNIGDENLSESDYWSVEFEEKEYTLPAAGGVVVIPVVSTGIDYATIKYSFEDSWDFTAEGNMTPREGWIDIVVIPSYPETRLLPTGRSGIELTVEPNERISSRSAVLIIGSSSAVKSVALHQPSLYE